jgi:arabinosyltransferase C
VQLPEVTDGISAMPEFRITATGLASEAGWADSSAGGPIGWLDEVATQPEVPSFLDGDPEQAWGELLRVEPYVDGDPPTVRRDTEVRAGWSSPGPGPMQPDGRSPTR